MTRTLSRRLHPVVLIELYQSQFSFIRAVIVLFLLALSLRLWFGFFGLVVAYVLLIPNIALSLGLGTFQEEINKGQLRFLYSMPVRWTTVWLMKMASAILGLVLVAGLIIVVTTVGNAYDMTYLPVDLQEAVENEGLWPLVQICGIFSMVAFIIGLFTIISSRSTKLAQLVANAIVYVPLIVTALLCMWFGIIPDIVAISSMAVGGSLVLFIGAWIIFHLRNPMDEHAWRDRGLTLLFLILGGCAFAGAGLAADSLGNSFRRVQRMPLDYVVNPQTGHIALNLHDGYSHFGLVIDQQGRTVYDLGRSVVPVREEQLTWRPGTNQVLCEPLTWIDMYTPFNSANPTFNRRKLVDLATGSMTPTFVEQDEQTGRFVLLKQWSTDGRMLYASDRQFMSPTPGESDEYRDINQVIMLDVDSGAVIYERLHEASAIIGFLGICGDYAILHGGGAGTGGGYGMGGYGGSMGGTMGMQASAETEDTESWLERVHLPELARQRITLGEDTFDWMCDEQGDRILAVEQKLHDLDVLYRVVEYRFDSPTPRVVLDYDQLPKKDVRDKVRAGSEWIDVEAEYIFGTDLIEVTVGRQDVPADFKDLPDDDVSRVVYQVRADTGERVDAFDALYNWTLTYRMSTSPSGRLSCVVNPKQTEAAELDDSLGNLDRWSTRFIFNRLDDLEADAWELAMPGHIYECAWLDESSVVFILDVSNTPPTHWGKVECVLFKMEVTTGELYRLYPDPGPVDIEQIKRNATRVSMP